MIPVLFKKNEQQFRTYGLGEITDIINPKVTRERNGQYLLYFQYPQNAKFSDVFEEDMRIKSDAGVRTKWQTFEISRVIRKEGQLIEVFAKHISQSLIKDALNPIVNVPSSNAQQALNIWNSNRIGEEKFDVWSDISTTSSTSWDIRDVSNAFEALAGVQGSILDVWGGEYEFDNKMIRLHKEMGRKSPVPLEYGRNITGLEQDQQEDNVYTSVYPFATYTAEDDNEPKTVTLPEYYIDGKYLEIHNKRKIQVVDFSGEFENDDIPTISRLRTLAENYLNANEVGLPHENLKVEYIDLSKTLDYQEFQTMEEVELNDRLPIFYPKFGITNENAKVVVINYDPVKEENISIELGVIGQSFRTVTTGGIGSRLDKVEKQQDATNNYIINSRGNRIWFETPDENMEHKIGDTWFEKNGPYDRIRVWNGNQWEIIIDSEDIDKNAKAIGEQQQEIAEVKQTAGEAVDSINTAVANAGFTSLDETISSVQSISNQAQINAGTALDNAQDAMISASTALTNAQTALDDVGQLNAVVSDINIDIDTINGTLDLKADSETVDSLNGTVSDLNTQVGIIAGELTAKVDSTVVETLTGRVNLAETNIGINAQGLALKANQSTVDTLAGTVSSLGTDIGVVAGQISSKVWNTDIQTAVDGIEVGGRNLVLNSKLVVITQADSDRTFRLVNNLEEITYTLSFDYDVKVENSPFDTFLIYTDRSIAHIPRTTDGSRVEYTFTVPEIDVGKPLIIYAGSNAHDARNNAVDFIEIKLEKGNIASDWTPAPEDTTALINHVESELTQKHDSITATVSSIDGRVATNELNLDGAITRVGNAEGRLTTVETNVSGLQTTVASKASQTQVTQLANGLSAVVSKTDQISEWNATYRVNTANPLPLLNIDGNQLERSYSYEVTLGIVGTGTVTSFVASLRANTASSWVLDIHTSNGSASNHPYIYLNENNYPMVSLYGHTSYYNVIATVKKTASRNATSLTMLSDNINLRVAKGDVVSQLNIDAGRTLISSSKILLNANTVTISGTAWMSGAVIANASIDGAKIQDATIGSAKIASLDVGKISGDTSNFVQSNWNQLSNTVSIDGTGINTQTTNARMRLANGYLQAIGTSQNNWTRFGINGIELENGAYFRRLSDVSDGMEWSTPGFLHLSSWGSRAMSIYSTDVRFFRDVNVSTALQTPRVDTSLAQFQSATEFRNRIFATSTDLGEWNFSGDRQIMFHTGGSPKFRIGQSEIQTYVNWNLNNQGITGLTELNVPRVNTELIQFGSAVQYRNRITPTSGDPGTWNFIGDRQIIVSTQGNTKFRFGGAENQTYVNFNMGGNTITNQSDERLKRDIRDIEINSLKAVKSWRVVGYNWIDEEMNNRLGRQMGLIAQNTPELAMYDSKNDTWSINSSKQTMMNTHAIQQLALREQNTNKVASQALQATETNNQKIERLEKRIEELESVA